MMHFKSEWKRASVERMGCDGMTALASKAAVTAGSLMVESCRGGLAQVFVR